MVRMRAQSCHTPNAKRRGWFESQLLHRYGAHRQYDESTVRRCCSFWHEIWAAGLVRYVGNNEELHGVVKCSFWAGLFQIQAKDRLECLHCDPLWSVLSEAHSEARMQVKSTQQGIRWEDWRNLKRDCAAAQGARNCKRVKTEKGGKGGQGGKGDRPLDGKDDSTLDHSCNLSRGRSRSRTLDRGGARRSRSRGGGKGKSFRAPQPSSFDFQLQLGWDEQKKKVSAMPHAAPTGCLSFAKNGRHSAGSFLPSRRQLSGVPGSCSVTVERYTVTHFDNGGIRAIAPTYKESELLSRVQEIQRHVAVVCARDCPNDAC